MNSIQQLSQAGMEISQFIDSAVGGREHKNEDRGRLFMAFLHVAQEHHRSILFLIEKRLFGSAFALKRILYEAVLRGLWFGGCATDPEIKRFYSAKNFVFRPANELVAMVDQAHKTGSYFHKAHRAAFSAMSGYTHTGSHQISRRLKGECVTWNYEEEEILEVIHNSNSFLFAYMRCFLLHFNYAEGMQPYLDLLDQYLSLSGKIFGNRSGNKNENA